MRIVSIVLVVGILFLGIALYDEVTVDDVLTALDKSGIDYEPRIDGKGIYDFEREGAERYLYAIQGGRITIYVFHSQASRISTQTDPFPAASAMPPEGSFGMGRILVFYVGDSSMVPKLREAFEQFDAQTREDLIPKRIIMQNQHFLLVPLRKEFQVFDWQPQQ